MASEFKFKSPEGEADCVIEIKQALIKGLEQMSTKLMQKSKGEENEWLKQIREMLEQDLEGNKAHTVCIYQVPKSLSSVKPEAYSPQLIGLGPYHHLRPDLYDMEIHKVAAAKRVKHIDFETLVNELKTRRELEIRECYHNYLKITNEALAYIIAIDGLFLLELLSSYEHKNGVLRRTQESTPRSTGKKLMENAIFRDVMMLENQIPFFVLRGIMGMEDHKLLDFCKALCPIRSKEEYEVSMVEESAHLLDLMYNMILPKKDKSFVCYNLDTQEEGRQKEEFNPLQDISSLSQDAKEVEFGFMRRVNRAINVGETISEFPGISNVVSLLTSSESNHGSSEVEGEFWELTNMV